MRFLHPEAAWWMVALFAAAVAGRVLARRRLGVATTSAWMFDRMSRASLLRRVPAAVFLAGVLLLGCALMQPVLPLAETETRSAGLDIVIALDLSSSMEEQMDRAAPPRTPQAALAVTHTDRRVARPPSKTRLEATKDAIKSFVGRRIDDRIGLVVFSDNAYVVSPLTLDHRYLVRYIDMVDNQLLRGEGMTAIGEGLALSNYLLARQAALPGRRNKVIVVFTDGENTIGREPLEALAESDAAGIRVHLVGVDLEDEITKKPAVQGLLRAVTRYGGRHFNAATSRELDAASRAIDEIEKGVLVSRTLERDAPVYQWFALPSLICFAAGFGLRAIPAFIDQT
jgi:Ca-activated chloride channel family protein